MKLSVILPTFNEAGHIVSLIEAIFLSVGDRLAEVVVVDDNSPDGTWKLCEELGKRYEGRLVVIRRKRNPGLVASLNEGIRRAKGEVVAWMDADFSMPPSELRLLLDAVESGADVAVGSRYVDGGRDARDDVPLHRFLSRVLTTVASYALVPGFKDYTSGFIAVRKDVLDRLAPLEGDYGEYFIDLIVRAFRQERRIVELPYACVPRATGESKTATNLWGFVRRGRRYALTLGRLWLSGLLPRRLA